MPHRLLNSSLDWFSKIAILIWVWFLPAAPAVLGVFILVFIDTLLGIKASMVRGIPFSSRRLSQVVSKCITYFLGIFATHLMQKIFIDDLGFDIFKFAVFVFASIELLSIYENVSIIIGRDIIKMATGIFKRSGKIKSAVKEAITDTINEDRQAK